MINDPVYNLTFSLKADDYGRLTQLALTRGYQTPSGFARALVEEAIGVVNFNPLSAFHTSLFSKQEKVIVDSLKDKPKTITEIATETGKWQSNIFTALKKMAEKNWVIETEMKFTGGRPARMFSLTEAGRMRLDQEADRLAKIAELSQQQSAAYARESAKAHPDDARPVMFAAHDPTSPQGRFATACIGALYRVTPVLSDKEIEAKLTQKVIDITGMVGENYTTWETETAAMLEDGWIE